MIRPVTVSIGELVGCFVVEVGERQAWPFVTFCDNRPARSRETRLYIDTAFSVVPETELRGRSGPDFVRLAKINNRTVARAVALTPSGLLIDFGEGTELQISGEPRANTTHDGWWLSDWVDS